MVSCYWNSVPDGRLSCKEVLYIYNADETCKSEMVYQDSRLFLRLSASLFADNCLLPHLWLKTPCFLNFWSMKNKGNEGKGRKKTKYGRRLNFFLNRVPNLMWQRKGSIARQFIWPFEATMFTTCQAKKNEPQAFWTGREERQTNKAKKNS